MSDIEVLATRGLIKNFGGLAAVNKVDLSVHEGQVVGLIGPNGSGKTTLINCVSGVYPPSAGTIQIGGQDATSLRGDQIARAGLRRTFQHALVALEMTVIENVMMGAHDTVGGNPLAAALRLPGLRKREAEVRAKAQETLDWLNVGHLAPVVAKEIAGPVLKLIELARGLVGDPRVLLLDEVAAGLNTEEKSELSERIRTIAHTQGVGVLLVEHDIDFVSGLADHLVVLDAGAVMAQGEPRAVLMQQEVINAYIGA